MGEELTLSDLEKAEKLIGDRVLLLPKIESPQLHFHLWLWLRFQWYKRVKRMNIIGFYQGVPIIKSQWLQKYQEPK